MVHTCKLAEDKINDSSSFTGLIVFQLKGSVYPSIHLPIYFVAPGFEMLWGWGTLGISSWGCAAGSLETLAYARASSAKFCYPILELTPLLSRNY